MKIFFRVKYFYMNSVEKENRLQLIGKKKNK